MEYVRTHDIRFSYRLSGTNNQWISLESNYIAFNNMAPGIYELEVRATNSGGLWSNPSTLLINIEPPIWLSIYAKILYLLLVITLFSYVCIERNKSTNEECTIRKWSLKLKNNMK